MIQSFLWPLDYPELLLRRWVIAPPLQKKLFLMWKLIVVSALRNEKKSEEKSLTEFSKQFEQLVDKMRTCPTR